MQCARDALVLLFVVLVVVVVIVVGVDCWLKQ